MMSFKMEELMSLVTELSKKYTSNESTSISYEKARQLMEAVIFCIEEAQNGGEGGMMVSQNETPEVVYQYGYRLVLEKTKRALELYHKLTEQFVYYGNLALCDTVIKGMPEFFRHYDPQFQPQNKILTLDYPTLYSVEHLKGIDAIYQYLSYLLKEQDFLKSFSENDVEAALQDYQEDPEELLINIPSVVLRYEMKKKKGNENISLQEWADMEKLLAERMYQ